MPLRESEVLCEPLRSRFGNSDASRGGPRGVIGLRDHIPLDSSDRLVISKAQELDAIHLSLNGDFADIVTYPPAKYKGIVVLQVRNHSEIIPQLLERLTVYLSAHDDMEHYLGRLLIAETHRIRSRR